MRHCRRAALYNNLHRIFGVYVEQIQQYFNNDSLTSLNYGLYTPIDILEVRRREIPSLSVVFAFSLLLEGMTEVHQQVELLRPGTFSF